MLNKDLALATLNLFGGFPLNDGSKKKSSKKTSKAADYSQLDSATLVHGFVFADELKSVHGEVELLSLVTDVAKIIGRSNAEINTAFHKSWEKVATASTEQLMLEQLMHYITTYGFERAGCYSPDTVYIPNELLELPADSKMEIIVVNGLSDVELKERSMVLLGSGVALKEATGAELVTVLNRVGFTADDVVLVSNREVRVQLYELLEIVPADSSEFVRYLVAVLTGSGMVIKDSKTYEAIKLVLKNAESVKRIIELLAEYEMLHTLRPLAETFNRYKRIWFALRGSDAALNGYVNRISKLSKTAHVPMPKNYLNSITELLLDGETIDAGVLTTELAKVNIFRKVRLYNALSYRMSDATSVVYRVRNGRGFAKELKKTTGDISVVRDIVLNSITHELDFLKGKTVRIPANVRYSFPTTEKQFSGSIPMGTTIAAEKNLILGVQWANVGSTRVDLDLSLSNLSGKFGWDGEYRSEGRDVMFSGDLTDAPLPNGASELFSIRDEAADAIYLLNVNHYNRSGGYGYYDDEDRDNEVDVPYKLVLGSDETKGSFGRNYLLDASKVSFSLADVMDCQQKTIGLLSVKDGEKKFVLEGSSIAKGISMRHGDVAEQVLQAFGTTMETRLYLNDVLTAAGATVVDENSVVGDDDVVDFDLTPLALKKDTILGLLSGS